MSNLKRKMELTSGEIGKSIRLDLRSHELICDDGERKKADRNERSPEEVLRLKETDRIRKQNMKKTQSPTPLVNNNDESLITMDVVGEKDIDMIVENASDDNAGSHGK